MCVLRPPSAQTHARPQANQSLTAAGRARALARPRGTAHARALTLQPAGPHSNGRRACRLPGLPPPHTHKRPTPGCSPRLRHTVLARSTPPFTVVSPVVVFLRSMMTTVTCGAGQQAAAALLSGARVRSRRRRRRRSCAQQPGRARQHVAGRRANTRTPPLCHGAPAPPARPSCSRLTQPRGLPPPLMHHLLVYHKHHEHH